jgi:hypothetical protein
VASVQPLGTDRAPARERELGVSGGNETNAPVGQQSTTSVARDKPARAAPPVTCRSARKLALDDPEATAWDQLRTVSLYRELPSGGCGRPWRSPRRRSARPLPGGSAIARAPDPNHRIRNSSYDESARPCAVCAELALHGSRFDHPSTKQRDLGLVVWVLTIAWFGATRAGIHRRSDGRTLGETESYLCKISGPLTFPSPSRSVN